MNDNRERPVKKRSFSIMRCIKRILFTVFIVAILATVAVTIYLSKQKDLIQNLELQIEQIKESTIPLRFMILSRSDTDISARFRFYNADGREIASFERAWSGYELAIDSLIVPVAGKQLLFPVRVFTDAIAPGKGTELFMYYDRDGFPAIFDSQSLDREARAALSQLFSRVKLTESLFSSGNTTNKQGTADEGEKNLIKPVPSIFGNAVHDIKQFRRFEIGVVYALLVRPDGGVEIIRE